MPELRKLSAGSPAFVSRALSSHHSPQPAPSPKPPPRCRAQGGLSQAADQRSSCDRQPPQGRPRLDVRGI
eukprot:3035817-Alexandrium_andersonii.AAC.1